MEGERSGGGGGDNYHPFDQGLGLIALDVARYPQLRHLERHLAQGLGFRFRFGIQGLQFGVWGLGFRVPGLRLS